MKTNLPITNKNNWEISDYINIIGWSSSFYYKNPPKGKVENFTVWQQIDKQYLAYLHYLNNGALVGHILNPEGILINRYNNKIIK
jgi:hypothetical protein